MLHLLAVLIKRSGSVVIASLVLINTVMSAEITLNGHIFTLPDGFDIELAAGQPLVNRPITVDFDEKGRLYVADSSGSNDKPQKQLVEKTHRIVRLEDTDGDGRFDRTVVFADKMMFPEGTLWHGGSLYVSAPPSIWKLTDTDDDGIADQRVEWFEGKTLTGCANDLHGPYLGLDGLIYWCKGASAEQEYTLSPQPHVYDSIGEVNTVLKQRKLVSKASHIFRRRVDGTGFIEQVMTGGMDNPVDVVFTQEGERIFSTTFLQRPGGGLRDGLIHAVYGGVYGKVSDVTNFHPRTGDLMPPLVHLGPAAPCGLTRYESNVFGDDFRDNLFACQFNMHKVSRHSLRSEGSSFQSTNSDFVVSSNIDFHPTDVLEDADGSLIICDTGGWYTLCCPTSQLTKPDILGAIYRVRRKSSSRLVDGRGQALDWTNCTATTLASRLADGRPTVVSRSMHALTNMGKAAISALRKELATNEDHNVRRNVIWTLTRIDDQQARALVQKGIADRNLSVRLASLQSVSLWRDWQASRPVTDCLEDDSDWIRRVAAEALGRMGDEFAIPKLILAANRPSIDRALQHALTYALIEIGKPIDLSAMEITKRTSMLERIVTIANDQMEGGFVDVQRIVPWLSSNDPILKETALWLVGRHSEWGDALASYFQGRIRSQELSDVDRKELVSQLSLFSKQASIQQLIADHCQPGVTGGTSDSRAIVLEGMSGSPLTELPSVWKEPLNKVLAEGMPDLVPLAIRVVRALPDKNANNELKTALLKIASNRLFSPSIRVEALAAIPDGIPNPDEQQLRLLIEGVRDEFNIGLRSTAVESLVKSKLDVASLGVLVESIPHVGPLELSRLLGAFEHCADEFVGRKLILALKQSPVLTSLRVDTVKKCLSKFPPSVQQQAEDLYSAINVEAGRQTEKLNELMNALSDGDIRRGQQVFSGQKAACSACHAMGYVGGTIGPDLSKIGKIRSERDLLEAIVFPSVSFVRSYEPVLVTTSNGKQFNGLIRKETPDEITLTTGAKDEVRIRRTEIDEIHPSSVSIMPAGLDTVLTKQQIADLIAFLKSRQ